MAAVDTNIGAKPQGSVLPYRGSVVPSVTDIQSAIDALYNHLNGADLLIHTVNANLTAARVVTDAVAITWNWATPNQVKAILGQFTGDVTNAAADSLALAIGAHKVTRGMQAQGAALSVIGVTGGVTADVADIAGTADQVLRVNTAGNALAFGTIATGGIAAGAVTYAKIQNEGASTLLGNPTGLAAAPSEIALAAALAFVTGALDVAAHGITAAKFRQSAAKSVVGNATNALADVTDIAGTANQFLQQNSLGTALGFVTMSGDATLTDGALTIAGHAVTNAKLRQGAGLSVIGVAGAATADEADIVGIADQVLRVAAAGASLGFGAIDLSKAAAATGILQAGSMPALTGAVQNSAGSLATTETIDLVFVIGDGTNVIPTGIAGYWSAPFDFACTIVAWSIVAKQSGSISVDVLKTTFTAFDSGATHPVIGDKISATAPITFTTATKAQSSTLTGWTTGVSVNDILAFNVASVTTCTQVVINIKVTKTS